MSVCPRPAAGLLVASLAAVSLPARADDRSLLNSCQALVDRAAQSSRNTGAANAGQDDAQLLHCRLVIREWTLRDSRMSVDERGRPLR
jgi:hypothetical protein